MSPVHLPTSRKPLWKRRTFWYGSFYGRVLLFALASAGGSALTGVLIGTVNWMRGGSSHSWWYWASFTLFANALFMMSIGLLVGTVICAGIAAWGWKWNLARRSRFSLHFIRRLVLPLYMGLSLTTLSIAVYWYLVHGGVVFGRSDMGDALADAEIVALPVFSLLLSISSIYLSKKKKRISSRTQKRAAVLSERLLPLD